MKITQDEYYKKLLKIAQDAAKERAKFNARMNETAYSKDDEDKLYQAYARKLENRYRWEPTDAFADRFSRLENSSASDLSNWMMGGGELNTFNDEFDPENLAKKAELEKFMPLVAGVAKEGKDWLSQSGSALRDLAAREYGYTRKELPQFLDKLREYQTQYDRAKILKQAQEEMPMYGLRKLVTPSAFQEFENAIATGGDYDAATAAKFGALDAGANSAMFLAPSAKLVKNPIVNGGVDALFQAAFEAGRQGGKQALSTTGQEFDIAPVLFAGGAGATKPAIVGTAQGAVSRLPGEGPAQFARGISKAVKTGDPVYTERSALERAIAEYNANSPKTNLLKELEPRLNDMASTIANNPPEVNEAIYRLYKSQGRESDAAMFKFFMDNKLSDKPAMYTDIVPLSTVEKGISVNSVPEKAKFFGVSPNADGTYDAANILSQYDKKLDAYRTIDKGGKVEFGSDIDLAKDAERFVLNKDGKVEFGSDIDLAKDAERFVLNKDTRDAYRRLFPAKYTDEASETGSSKAGRIAGELLAGFGSRVEPTFKTAGTKIGLPERTYKDEQWYKKLEDSENGQVLRKLIEEALKDKKKK